MRKINKMIASVTIATVILIGTTLAKADSGGDGGVIVNLWDEILRAFGVIVN